MVRIRQLQKEVLKWFESNKRSLPWRINNHWYQRWISEIMLQQTQVEQVISYFNTFINKYPSVQSLAKAPIEDILKTWEGLGYYSRARNLHKTAQILCSKYNGVLPSNKKELIQLPGFGVYTTHALLSIVFNQPYSVVDGNVLRVITRIFTLKEDIRLPGTVKAVQNKMNQLIDKIKPGEFNEAIMELGATICLPKNPLCSTCPIKIYCRTNIHKLQNKIPYKSAPAKKPHVMGLTYILFNRKKFYIAQRPYKGLLAGLWEFPTFTFNQQTLPDQSSLNRLVDKKIVLKQVKLLPVKHSYTHFRISIHPYLILTNKREIKNLHYQKYQWINYTQLTQYAMHIAMRKVLQKNKNQLEIVAP
jgi:A/G-specific adenine glycosylase